MRLILASVLLAGAVTTAVAATKGEVRYPEVKFSLENSSYTETLTWISGFSYAISYTSKVAQELGKPAI